MVGAAKEKALAQKARRFCQEKAEAGDRQVEEVKSGVEREKSCDTDWSKSSKSSGINILPRELSC